jgi:2,4-dienoyl-CoA reductase-like NADH-dependent reductase (Old Yellow Enzyme family)
MLIRRISARRSPSICDRIVMAPLTRMRAGPIDHVPTALQAEYYLFR